MSQKTSESAMLRAIAQATNLLLVSQDIYQAVNESLRLLGKASKTSTAYYFEIVKTGDVHICKHISEWIAAEDRISIRNNALDGIVAESFAEAFDKLKKGIPYQNTLEGLDDELPVKQYFIRANVVSFILIPVVLEGLLFGFLGFDDCLQKRLWREKDVALFQSFANGLASGLDRQRKFDRIQKAEFLLEKTNETARIGTWEVDLEKGVVYWSKITYEIHEIDKFNIDDAISLEKAIAYYSEESRDFVRREVERSINLGKGFDFEAQIKTAKSKVVWVNSKGLVEAKDNKVIKVFGTFQDIDPKKRAQLQAVLEAKKFATLFENANDAIVVFDKSNGEIIAANSMLESLTKIDRTRIIGKDITSLFLSGQALTAEMVAHLLKISKNRIFEQELLLLDGSTLPVEISAQSLEFDTNHTIQYFIRDISQHKKAQSELLEKNKKLIQLSNQLEQKIIQLTKSQEEIRLQKEQIQLSENRYKTVVESQSDFVIISNAQLNITFVNQPLVKVLDMKANEIIGKNWSYFLISDEYDDLLKKISRLHSDKTVIKHENHYVNKRNEIGWTEWISRGLYNNKGELIQIQSVGRDISKIKLVQQALAKSERQANDLAKRYKSILDSQSVYVLKTDAHFRLSYVNQYYKTEFGSLALEAKITEVLPITEKKILADALETCLQNPEHSYNFILELKSLEGKLKGNKWELKSIINQEGEVEEMVLVGYDISEQLENLAHTKKLLEITSLQNTRLQNFTYIVSHNIRSHTANLSGLISFIQKTTSDKEKDYFFSLLKSTTEKLDETITNLNEVITINKNTSKLREKLNLKKEVEKTLDIVSVSLHSKNIKIKNNLSGNEFVPAIPAYLDSILLNLISNAIKYRDPQRNLLIQIDAEQTDGYLKLLIQDNGLGIDMKRNASKLFGMYKTFHENEDARGLGLFLTKNQVEAMNGRIEVLSEVGKGSTFIIYFDANF